MYVCIYTYIFIYIYLNIYMKGGGCTRASARTSLPSASVFPIEMY